MYNRYSLFFFLTDNTVVSLVPMSCIQEIAWKNIQVWLRSRDLNGQPQSSPHTLNLSICSPRTPITEQTNREESRCCNWDNAAEVGDSLLFKGSANLMLIAWNSGRLHLVLQQIQVCVFSRNQTIVTENQIHGSFQSWGGRGCFEIYCTTILQLLLK